MLNCKASPGVLGHQLLAPCPRSRHLQSSLLRQSGIKALHSAGSCASWQIRAKSIFVSTCSLLFSHHSCSDLELTSTVVPLVPCRGSRRMEKPIPPFLLISPALLSFMAKNCLMAMPTKFLMGKSKTLALLTAEDWIFPADNTSFLTQLPSFYCCVCSWFDVKFGHAASCFHSPFWFVVFIFF